MVDDHSSLIELGCLYIDLLSRLVLLKYRRMSFDVAPILPVPSESMLIFRAVGFLKLYIDACHLPQLAGKCIHS